MENKLLLRQTTTLSILFAVSLWCAPAFAYTFSGTLIDAETKEPIEGAAVVAHWHEEQATPTGPYTRLKDVKETLSDKDGKWIIKGPKGGEFGNVKALISFLTWTRFTNRPEFIIFKPGYCSIPEGLYIDACKGIKKRNGHRTGDGVTIELPKLENRDDRIRGIPSAASGIGSLKKQKELIRLINEERNRFGLGAIYRTYEVPKNE